MNDIEPTTDRELDQVNQEPEPYEQMKHVSLAGYIKEARTLED